MRIEVEVTEDGRIVAPPGMRLKITAEVVESDKAPEEDPERAAKLQAVWDSIDADADTVVLKPWPEGDPIVEKYRRKGLID